MLAALFSKVTLLFLSFSSVSLSYFILAVPRRKCCEGHPCMSFPVPNRSECYLTYSRGEIVLVLGGFAHQKLNNNNNVRLFFFNCGVVFPLHSAYSYSSPHLSSAPITLVHLSYHSTLLSLVHLSNHSTLLSLVDLSYDRMLLSLVHLAYHSTLLSLVHLAYHSMLFSLVHRCHRHRNLFPSYFRFTSVCGINCNKALCVKTLELLNEDLRASLINKGEHTQQLQ